MVNWSITATTIYCDAVDDEATVMVYKDGTFKCVARQKYDKPSKPVARLMKEKGKKLKRDMKCDGENCPRVKQYRDKLFEEEKQSP